MYENRIRAVIDKVTSRGTVAFADFIAEMSKAGIDAVPNVAPSTGRMNGFRFSVRGKDESFTGQDLGPQYTWTEFKERVIYDKDADRPLAVKLKYGVSTAGAAAAPLPQPKEKTGGIEGGKPKVDLVALLTGSAAHMRALSCDLEVAVRDQDVSARGAWTRNWRVLAAGQSMSELVGEIADRIFRRCNIYVAPLHKDEGLVMIDDLKSFALKQLLLDDLPPVAFVKTSAEKYQAWLRLGGRGDRNEFEIGAVARVLAKRYELLGADPNAARRGQLGRLAGTYNLKPEHFSDGYPPVEILHTDAAARPSAAALESLLRDAADQAERMQANAPASVSDREAAALVERYLQMTKLTQDEARIAYRQGEAHLVSKSPDYYLKKNGEIDNSRIISSIAIYRLSRRNKIDDFAIADTVAILIHNPRAAVDPGYLMRMGINYAVSKLRHSG